MSIMKIAVDRRRCTGIGICESIAESHFEVRDDGTLAVLIEEVSAQDLALAQEAVDGCPARALKLIQADS